MTVEALRLDQSDLNTKRMMELMVFDRAQPLYASVVQRILRDMRLAQQDKPSSFNYREFRNKLDDEPLSQDQKRGLQQRLDSLESFMVAEQVKPFAWNKSAKGSVRTGTDWTPKVGYQLGWTFSSLFLTSPIPY